MGFRIGRHVDIQLSPLKAGPSVNPAEQDIAVVNSAAVNVLNKHAKLNGYGDCEDENFYVALKTVGDRQPVRWKARGRKKEKSLIVRCRVTEVSTWLTRQTVGCVDARPSSGHNS